MAVHPPYVPQLRVKPSEKIFTSNIPNSSQYRVLLNEKIEDSQGERTLKEI